MDYFQVIIHKTYFQLIRFLFFLMPLILLIPQQFSKSLYSGKIFWIVVVFSFLVLPKVTEVIKNNIREKSVILFLIYLGVLILCSLFSVNSTISLSISALYISYFLIFIVSPRILSTYELREKFTLIFFLTVIALSVISLYNTLFRRYVNLESEGLSFLWVYWGHNHLAALLLFAIPLSAFFLGRFYSNKLLRVTLSFILLFLLYSLLITSSRAAAISLLISAIIGSMFLKNIFPQKTKDFFRALLILLIAFILLIFSFTFLRKFPSGIESRIFHWQKGIEIFSNNPYFGSGPGTYQFVIKYEEDFKYARSRYALNLPIQIAADTGLLGLIAGLSLYSFVIYQCIKIFRGVSLQKDSLLNFSIGLGIIGVLLNELMDFDLQLASMGLIFWIMVGLIIKTQRLR